jgi:hypothetical protein
MHSCIHPSILDIHTSKFWFFRESKDTVRISIRDMALEKRNTFPYTFQELKVDTLLAMESRLTKISGPNFRSTYGSILELLHVKVDTRALVTFSQFYDPHLRCFTFQDFQLLPTIEEFENILGICQESQVCYMREVPSTQSIAKALHLKDEEVESLFEEWNGTKGFSKKALESKAQNALSAGNWKAHNALLALLIYGLVMFPNLNNFVDLAAVGVFLNGNHAPTLLADFLHSLHDRHGTKRGGQVTCCVPIVMKWLMFHLPNRGPFVDDKSVKWSDKLSSLSEKDIRWFSRELESSKVLLKCGGFANVPLVGTRGCINYNPILAFRQLGYPMEGAPPEASVAGFVLKEEMDDPELWGKIKRAWKSANKTPMPKKNCLAKEAYNQWVKKRVLEIRMPFAITAPTTPQKSEHEPVVTISKEEADALKDQIVQLKEKNEKWQMQHFQDQGDIKILKRERDEKEKEIQACQKKVKDASAKVEEFKDGLASANENLKAKNETIRLIEHSNKNLYDTGRVAMAAQGKWQKKCQEQEQELQNLNQKYRDLVQEETLKEQKWQKLLSKEKRNKEKIIDTYEKSMAQITRGHEESASLMNERIKRLEGELRQCREQNEAIRREAILEIGRMKDDLRQHKLCIEVAQQSTAVWKRAFIQMATLSNAAIDQLPRNLRMAELDLPLYNVPEGIKSFLEYCRGLLRDYKEALWETRRHH